MGHFYVANPWGDSDDSPSVERMRMYLDAIDPNDVEHGAAWLSDDDGNSLEFNHDGRIVLTQGPREQPRHIVGISKAEALRLWRLLAEGRLHELQGLAWRTGSRPGKTAG
jgi:hypothetical protein